MKLVPTLCVICFASCAVLAQAGEIDGRAVVGGALGGAAGAAVGSAVGGRTGAVVGAGVGAATGSAIATQPSRPEVVRVERPVVVEKQEVIVEHEHDCWPPGHCKHRRKHGDD